MSKIKKLIEDTINETVSEKEEKEAILEAISLEKIFGESKSINILDKYEDIIEGLIK